jgi:hypothetical protein
MNLHGGSNAGVGGLGHTTSCEILSRRGGCEYGVVAKAAMGAALWAAEPSEYIECICLTCCKFSAVSQVADPPA